MHKKPCFCVHVAKVMHTKPHFLSHEHGGGMEVRAGYKMTEVGVIPMDWGAKPLGEIGDSLIGLTYRPSEVRKYGTLVLRSSNVQNGTLCFESLENCLAGLNRRYC